LKHAYFKDLRDQDLVLLTAGPQGFGHSVSKNNFEKSVSQNSLHQSDNVSEQGGSKNAFYNSISGSDKVYKGKISFPTGTE